MMSSKTAQKLVSNFQFHYRIQTVSEEAKPSQKLCGTYALILYCMLPTWRINFFISAVLPAGARLVM